MIIVNPYFLDEFLGPLTGLADDDEAVEHYRHIELKTEAQYKSVIRDKLIEHFKNLDEEKQQKAKLALSYYLSKPEISFERVFDSLLPPFDAPINARDLFVWIREELFQNEDYMFSDYEKYRVVPYSNQPIIPVKMRK